MSTLELVLNMLAEATTTEISKQEQPQGFASNIKIAQEGGLIAGDARKAIEHRTGKSVITSKNALDFTTLIDTVIQELDSSDDDSNK